MLTAHDLLSAHAADAPPDGGPKRERAWVTLLSDRSYFSGVKALYSSLEQSDTDYPLIVMVTPAVPEEVRKKLSDLGEDCIVREVEPLPLPRGTGAAPSYACAHFADCWAKLRMWEWEAEFERLCYLDADMLLLKHMDELLADDDATGGDDDAIAGGAIDAACRSVRAVQECFCPVVERREHCAYRQPAGTPPAWPYFNAGLLVLRPCTALFAHMTSALETADLGAFPFAEQDFLNLYFGGRASPIASPQLWTPLPWVYNASKALYASHRGPQQLWDLSAVKNLHYTMAKPWDLRHPCHKGYEKLNELWHAAYAQPNTLARTTLKAVMHERKALASKVPTPSATAPTPLPTAPRAAVPTKPPAAAEPAPPSKANNSTSAPTAAVPKPEQKSSFRGAALAVFVTTVALGVVVALGSSRRKL